MYSDYKNQQDAYKSIELFPVPQREYQPNYEQRYRPKPIPKKKKKKNQKLKQTYNLPKRPNKNQFVERVNQIHTQGRKTHSTANEMLQNFTRLTMLVGVIALGIVGLKAYLDKLNIKDLEGNVYGGEAGETYSGGYDNSTEQGRVKNKIIAEAQRQGVDPAYALAVAETESHFNQNAKSGVGAIGVFQLMPQTAKGLGVDPYNLDDNIRGGIRLLKGHLDKYGGDKRKALAAYNWGSGNLAKYGIENAPAETRGHYQKIMAAEQKFKNELKNMGPSSSSYKSVDMGSITKAKSVDNKGIHYDESSNITSHTKLTSQTNSKYNANVGQMGTFDGYTITSGIGRRNVPGGSSFHRGLDLGFAYGTPVKAFCSGTVTHCNTMSGFGRCVIINDKNGFRHVYGHLSAYKVNNGQKVKKGQVIALSGSSGTVNGRLQDKVYAPHLHYGIWRKGGTSDKKDYIDPRTYIYPPEDGEIPQTQSQNDKINKTTNPPKNNIQNNKVQNNSINKQQKTTQKQPPTQKQSGGTGNTTLQNNKPKTPNNKKDIGKPDQVGMRVNREDKKYKK